MKNRNYLFFMCIALLMALFLWKAGPAVAKPTPIGQDKGNIYGKMRSTTMAQRRAAAANAKMAGLQPRAIAPHALTPVPGGTPDYFGPYPNYANSPLPKGGVGIITVVTGGTGYTAPVVIISDPFQPTASGATASATVNPSTGTITAIATLTAGTGYMAPVVSITDPTGTGATVSAMLNPTSLVAGTGMRKFIDTAPALTIAVADTTTYPGSDYYEIELRQYTQKMHSDLPPTTLRGYVQVKNGVDVSPISYLGPVILAQRNRPARVKFTNKLPTGAGGNLFIPTDTTYMGAGMGANGTEMYTQNRATLHLHGGTTPWISDGTPHQWTTPAAETTSYPKGVSVQNVPDMPAPGPGSLTFFYSNQQSARLMFYHDHAYGITRLNVYAGEAAGYLLTDSTEMTLINGGTITYKNAAGVTQNTVVAPGTIPDLGIPLVIQDKTFVPPAAQLAAQDPTWNWGTLPTTQVNGTGNLWFPHVYMPNQNPWDLSGANAMGRWDYGPWFWPPFTNLQFGPVANPYYDPVNSPWEPPQIPGVPNVSGVPESFMDTPLVNGKAYPYMTVPAGIVRFRILNAANDHYWNLSLWVADPAVTTGDGRTNTEVKMVPFNATQNTLSPFPTWWYTVNTNGFTFDDRAGGVPDPTTRGPAMIQIGTEGGVLPAPVVVKNQPINFVYNRRDVTVGNVKEHALFLGPAERADILVDFTKFAGKTLILYSDSPTPVPAADPRNDYYTGDQDLVSMGGAPTTLPGFGPNTRTIMQFRVAGSGGTAPVDDYNPATLTALKTALPAAFAASQDPIIVPQAAYNSIYGTNTVDTPGGDIVRIQDLSLTFTPLGQTTPLLFNLSPKAIIENFQMDYGRMNAILGVEIPNTNITNQTSIIQAYIDPPSEVVKASDPSITQIGALGDGTQIWKIVHNGVDTHAIHFHMFNVQVINRVGWDGAIRLPDPNELGWKDTVRMNPLEIAIVALRPIKLVNLPFKVPNSFRLLDPTMPLHSTTGFTNVAPDGSLITVSNELTNYGWEYVWHCHLLGHEENDMMRAMALAVAPEAPINLGVVLSGSGASLQAILTWTDNSANETSFTIQKAAAATGPWTNLATIASATGPNYGGPVTYTDAIGNVALPVYYRVYASDTVGSVVSGYPQITADSIPSNTAATQTTLPPAAPTNLTATLQNGPQILLGWRDNSTNETGFVIERAINGGAFAALLTVGPRAGTGGTVNYTDTGVSVGNTYSYRVMATNAGGNSAYTNTATVTISNGPAAPSNVAARGRRVTTSDIVLVTWMDNSTNETGFRIQMATNAGFTTGLVTSTMGANASSFVTGNVPRNTQLWFRVQSYNASGPSPWVNATPFPTTTP